MEAETKSTIYQFGVGRAKRGSTTVHILRDAITARCGFTPREWLIQADELPKALRMCARCETVDRMNRRSKDTKTRRD